MNLENPFDLRTTTKKGAKGFDDHIVNNNLFLFFVAIYEKTIKTHNFSTSKQKPKKSCTHN